MVDLQLLLRRPLREFDNKDPSLNWADIRMIKQIGKVIPELKEITNTTVEIGTFTDNWKIRVVFFVKEEKNPEQAGPDRPICFLPVFSKVLEKLITKMILYHLEHKYPMSKNQYGLQGGISTEHANL